MVTGCPSYGTALFPPSPFPMDTKEDESPSLPHEIWMMIFLSLSPYQHLPTLGRLSCVCTLWAEYLKDDQFWRAYYMRYLGGPPPCSTRSWREHCLPALMHLASPNISIFTPAPPRLASSSYRQTSHPRICNLGTILFAAQRGHHILLEFVFLHRPELLQETGRRNRNPLYYASREGHLSVVELLLQRGVEVDVALPDGTTALHSACQHGHHQVAELLLRYGAVLNLRRNSGATPLYLAAQEGHREVVRVLLENGAAPDLGKQPEITPLCIATKKGHTEIVTMLSEYGQRVGFCGVNESVALHVSAYSGQLKLTEELIRLRGDINQIRADGKSSISHALRNGNPEMFDLLLRYGSSLPDDGLTLAAHAGNISLMEKLIYHFHFEVDGVNQEGKTALHIALSANDRKSVLWLLRNGANPNFPTTKPPLCVAAQSSRISSLLTKDLLRAGADVNLTDQGVHALHYAAATGNLELVNQLMAFSRTPLDFDLPAARSCAFPRIIRGDTALHCAIRSSHSQVVAFLIAHGSSVHATTLRGESIHTLSRQQDDVETQRIVLRNSSRNPSVSRRAKQLVHRIIQGGSP